MSIEIKIPKVGESIAEVQISEWLKSAGDQVRKDEPLAIIDSEKTTFELPATDSGRLTEILHQAGETVSVGSVIAHLEPVESPAPPAAKPSGDGSKQESKPAPVREARPKNKRNPPQTTAGATEPTKTDGRRPPSAPSKTQSAAVPLPEEAEREPADVAPAEKA